ncbi:prophage P1 protein 30 [Lactiplantibacillus plantarum]|nr:prophage P1 protein 30 [Lactiplantibacillus plantarum]MCG0912724.1 prophage P1 protein 30 [Lactiplantibacillus plantarum]
MIKFRAWDKNENRYIIDGKDGYFANLLCCDDWDMVDSNSYVWEQFTGLKEVNGKDIYVGDILKTKAGLIQIVEQGILESDCENIISGFYANNISDNKPHTFSQYDKVIGNVHANPELLEAEK